MQADSLKNVTSGKLEGPRINESICKVVLFVLRHLASFHRLDFVLSIDDEEEELTQELRIFLDNCARQKYPFTFVQEFIETKEKRKNSKAKIGKPPKVDIGVLRHGARKAFFVIEAKRLKSSEKEYLVGRWKNGKYIACGGVERFKKEIHGKDLEYAAIIGYVQRFDFNYWEDKINKRVKELAEENKDTDIKWSEKDQLQRLRHSHETAAYQSENTRNSGSFITLFHLWVNLVR